MQLRAKATGLIALAMLVLFALPVFAGGGQEEGGQSGAQAEEAEAQAEQPEEKVLRIGISQEPANLNPVLIPGVYGEALAGNIFDTLVSLKEDSSDPKPLLATDWEISDDGQTYTFNLREGVTFHNGEELTAEDVKFTLDQIKNPDNASPSIEFFEPVTNIVVEDEYTVRLELDAPYAPLMLALGNPTAGIIPKDTVEEMGMDEFDRNPIGTGPYQFVELVPDDRIVLEKNPDYFLEEPGLDRVVFRPIPQPETMAAELQAGGLDIASNIQPQDIDRLDNREGMSVLSKPGLSNRYLGFADQQAPFNDVRFRKAVYHAVDFASAIEAIWGQAGERAYSWIPPDTLGGETDYLEDAVLSYDPEEAGRLFDELRADGVLPEDFSFTIYSPQDPQRTRVAQAVATAMQDYDIQASVETPEWGTLLPMLEDGVGMYTLGWGSVPDPDRWTYKIFHSTSNRNFSLYQNERIDSLLEEGRRTTDPNERRDIYHEIMTQTLAEDYVHIPLVWLNTIVGVRDRVEGFEASPQGYFHLVTGERNVTVN